ncbi:hypothetical protein BHM03_00059112 [Ensete ventricosum]|nr:hypothetical protein BHM03_00059112 [Ensete ventricosum]
MLQAAMPASNYRPYGLAAAGHPFAGGLGHNSPFPVARSWQATHVGGLAVADHPCRWPRRGQPPMQRPGHSQLPRFLVVFTVKIQQECVE